MKVTHYGKRLPPLDFLAIQTYVQTGQPTKEGMEEARSKLFNHVNKKGWESNLTGFWEECGNPDNILLFRGFTGEFEDGNHSSWTYNPQVAVNFAGKGGNIAVWSVTYEELAKHFIWAVEDTEAEVIVCSEGFRPTVEIIKLQ